MNCSAPGAPVLHYVPEFAQTHVHWVSDAIQPSHALLPSSPALNLSQHQGLFQWVNSLHQVPKVLELQHQYFQWIFRVGFLSFRIDWLDLLAVQATLKSLLQQNSSKSSIFQCSDFFMVQLSHPHMTTEKTTALTIWTFVGKVMSLLNNHYESLPLKTILHLAKECLPIFVSLKIFKALKLRFDTLGLRQLRSYNYQFSSVAQSCPTLCDPMVNTEIRLIIFFAAKDGEALYSQQKQD